LDRFDHCEWGRLDGQATEELLKYWLRSLGLNQHTLCVVQHPTDCSQLPSKSVDERPEADTLNSAPDANLDALPLRLNHPLGSQALHRPFRAVRRPRIVNVGFRKT